MAEDNDDASNKRQRRTVDEKLAANADEARQLHQIKRAQRTHGHIVIGAATVTAAQETWSLHAWLHIIWSKANARDKEALRVACGDLDVTKPPPKPKADASPSQPQDMSPAPTKSPDPAQVT